MRHRQIRPGFTLIELLVAIALIFFIMSILTAAFIASSKSFTDLKAEGDLAEKLNTAAGILRKYLLADHFEGKRRLSDPSFWANGPPQEGFFRIYQGTPSSTAPNVLEGTDLKIGPAGSPLPCYRVINHALHFAVKLRGNNLGDFFSAEVPAGSPVLSVGTPDARWQTTPPPSIYRAQWGEVAFFLQPLQFSATEAVTANGTQLYGLFMRQRLAVPDISGTQTTVPGYTASDYVEISGINNAGTLACNGPRDLTQPARRFGMTTTNLAGISNAAITAATNATPIQITSANHGLTTGQPVIIGGVQGNTAANGIWIVTVVDANNFTLNGSIGNGAYTAGGTWSKYYTTFAQDVAAGAANYQKLVGSDLLLTNVVSFEVRLMLLGGNDFVELFDPTVKVYDNGNPNFPSATGPMAFDTWSSTHDDLFDYSNWMISGSTATTLGLDPNASIPLWGPASLPISAATNAAPIQITSNNHGLVTGQAINISGVGGNTAANGTWTVTFVDNNNFTLTNSDGTASGTYTPNTGTWSRNGPIIKALQITLRVWDEKNENTRQITFVVPM
jgi:hypothetical protein